MCVCNAEENKRCLFHARAPRQCSCGGTLTRLSKGEGGVIVAWSLGNGPRQRRHVQHLRQARPIWVCNTCEHCEEAS